jgi:hypothetical protein
MSTFNERDLVALDAEVVRVRITLPEAFALDVGKSWLGVELASAAGAHQPTFELDQERVQTGVIPGGIFSSSQRGIVYVLRLSSSSQAKFRDLQRFMGKGRADQVSIRVVPRLASFPKDAASVKVWIDLLLSKTQDYFTLLDGATVDLQKLRAPGAGSSTMFKPDSGSITKPPVHVAAEFANFPLTRFITRLIVRK